MADTDACNCGVVKPKRCSITLSCMQLGLRRSPLSVQHGAARTAPDSQVTTTAGGAHASASSRQRRCASFLRSRAHVVRVHRMQRLRPGGTSAGRPRAGAPPDHEPGARTRMRAGARRPHPALSGSLRRASQMLARSLEQVCAWRRVAGSVGRLRGSGGERRRFGTAGAARERTPPAWASPPSSATSCTLATSRRRSSSDRRRRARSTEAASRAARVPARSRRAARGWSGDVPAGHCARTAAGVRCVKSAVRDGVAASGPCGYRGGQRAGFGCTRKSRPDARLTAERPGLARA